MLRSGLVSVTFRKHSPAELVALVAQAGLEGIEWGGDVHVPHGEIGRAKEVRSLTESAGLRVAAYGSYYRAGVSEDEGGPQFGRVLETALALGAPTIRVWAGNFPSEGLSAELRRKVVADLQRICGLAADCGVTVSTEFHGGTLTDTNASALRLFEEVGHPNLYSYWQPHVGESLADCVAGLRPLLAVLSHVHVFQWTENPRMRHPLEEGEARWAEFFGLIRGARGERFAMLEFVKDDAPEVFLRDAATLKKWLTHFNSSRPGGAETAGPGSRQTG